MKSLDAIKKRMEFLYKTHPNIHINVSMTNPKVNFNNEPVLIKGVYPHVFQIEETGSGHPKFHTLQYIDVFLHRIEIVELEEE